MRNQNLFEAIQRLTGFTPLESDMDEIIDAIIKDRAEQVPRIKIWHTRRLELLMDKELITYSRMVELLNEIAAGKHQDTIEL